MVTYAGYEAVLVLAITRYRGEIGGILEGLNELVTFLEVGCLCDQKGVYERRRDCIEHRRVRLCWKRGQPNDPGAAEQRTCVQFCGDPVWSCGGIGVMKPDYFHICSGPLCDHRSKGFSSCRDLETV